MSIRRIVFSQVAATIDGNHVVFLIRNISSQAFERNLFFVFCSAVERSLIGLRNCNTVCISKSPCPIGTCQILIVFSDGFFRHILIQGIFIVDGRFILMLCGIDMYQDVSLWCAVHIVTTEDALQATALGR